MQNPKDFKDIMQLEKAIDAVLDTFDDLDDDVQASVLWDVMLRRTGVASLVGPDGGLRGIGRTTPPAPTGKNMHPLPTIPMARTH